VGSNNAPATLLIKVSFYLQMEQHEPNDYAMVSGKIDVEMEWTAANGITAAITMPNGSKKIMESNCIYPFDVVFVDITNGECVYDTEEYFAERKSDNLICLALSCSILVWVCL
jgi:hypothetical protein